MPRSSFFCLLLMLSGCNQVAFDSNEALMDYVQDEENGYSQTKTVNGIEVCLTYRPTEMMAAQHGSPTEGDSLKKLYNRNLYFVLSYSKNGKEILSAVPSSREQFNALQNELTYGMRERTSLTTEKNDTIPLLDFNFSRTYGLAHSNSLLLIYEKNENFEKCARLSFNLKDIGLGTGDMTFEYPATLLKNKLIIN
jgi:hypothetical protein